MAETMVKPLFTDTGHMENKCRVFGREPGKRGGGHCHCIVTDYNRNVLRGCWGKDGTMQEGCSVCGSYAVELKYGQVITMLPRAEFDARLNRWIVVGWELTTRITTYVEARDEHETWERYSVAPFDAADYNK